MVGLVLAGLVFLLSAVVLLTIDAQLPENAGTEHRSLLWVATVCCVLVGIAVLAVSYRREPPVAVLLRLLAAAALLVPFLWGTGVAVGRSADSAVGCGSR